MEGLGMFVMNRDKSGIGLNRQGIEGARSRSIMKSRLCRGEILGLWPRVKSFASLTVKLNPSSCEAGFHHEVISPTEGGSHPSERTDLIEKTSAKRGFFMAGVLRLELRRTVLETAMLPLHHTPILFAGIIIPRTRAHVNTQFSFMRVCGDPKFGFSAPRERFCIETSPQIAKSLPFAIDKLA